MAPARRLHVSVTSMLASSFFSLSYNYTAWLRASLNVFKFMLIVVITIFCYSNMSLTAGVMVSVNWLTQC